MLYLLWISTHMRIHTLTPLLHLFLILFTLYHGASQLSRFLRRSVALVILRLSVALSGCGVFFGFVWLNICIQVNNSYQTGVLCQVSVSLLTFIDLSILFIYLFFNHEMVKREGKFSRR